MTESGSHGSTVVGRDVPGERCGEGHGAVIRLYVQWLPTWAGERAEDECED